VNYFAAVYLDHHDQPTEAAEQVMWATAEVLKAAGGKNAGLFVTEADTGSDSAGVVISTAELTQEDATTLWNAFPYDEDTLNEWEYKGWTAVSGE
jgi:hypothetical protein